MANYKELQAQYSDLIETYNTFKPVFFFLYKKNKEIYLEGILNEFRAINDHIARCFRPNISLDQASNELNKAEGHLKRLIYDSFKQLNIIFHYDMDVIERKHFGPHWLTLLKGKFWEEYTQRRHKIINKIETAKLSESHDPQEAIDNYQDAFLEQKKVYDLLENNRKHLSYSFIQKIIDSVKTNIGWLITTLILTLVTTLIWEIILHYLK